jgi:ABC-type uncharacterized transport system auxiliary subunit
MNTANRMIRNVALLTFLGLAACGSLTTSDIPANQTWWLVPYENSGQLTHTGALDRVTVEVTVVPGLDNNRILTLTGDAELNRYAAARWADNLPELVTSLVGRTLAASGRFNVTTGLDGGPGENCVLQLEVREFFAELASSGETTGVRIGIAGSYQCGSAKTISLILSSSATVNEDRMRVIVAAFQQALDSVLKDLLKQI